MVRELITVDGVDRSFGPVDVLKDINMIEVIIVDPKQIHR